MSEQQFYLIGVEAKANWFFHISVFLILTLSRVVFEKGWETIEWEIEVKPNWLVHAGGSLGAQTQASQIRFQYWQTKFLKLKFLETYDIVKILCQNHAHIYNVHTFLLSVNV